MAFSRSAAIDHEERTRLVRLTQPTTLAADRLLPVLPPLAALLPGGGLRRGTVVEVGGSLRLALALAASVTQADLWAAAVGIPKLGVVAAVETGVALQRFVLVPDPDRRWAQVVATLLYAVDLVLTRLPAGHGQAMCRRLTARARERGSVLLVLGAWPSPDLTLRVRGGPWLGLAAGGAAPSAPAAVLHAGRVVACSPAARAEGVRPGLRRREAQGRCPGLELLAHDPARDARAFEPVLVAVEALTPWVEVLRPGECAFPARGAARHHGGEPALATAVTAAVHAALGGPPPSCRVGIADGTFAAGLAARHQAIVPPGGSQGFLAPFPVATLERPDLADLLVRLGLRTLGDLAALPGVDLATRFGPEGSRAHRLASGLDEWPRAARRPPPDLRMVAELDPPAERVDVAAFAAKALADELVTRLERLGLACTRLRVEA